MFKRMWLSWHAMPVVGPANLPKIACNKTYKLLLSFQNTSRSMSWRHAHRQPSRKKSNLAPMQLLQSTTHWQSPLYFCSSPNQPTLRRIVEWPLFSSVLFPSVNPSFYPPKSWDATSAISTISATLLCLMLISHMVLVLGAWMARSV